MLICNHFTPEAKERGLLVPPTRRAEPARRRASPPGAAPRRPRPSGARPSPAGVPRPRRGWHRTQPTPYAKTRKAKRSGKERRTGRGPESTAARSPRPPGRAPPRRPPPYAAPSSPRSGLSGRLSTNGKSRPRASQGARNAWGSKLPPGSASPPRSASAGGTKRHVPARLTQ